MQVKQTKFILHCSIFATACGFLWGGQIDQEVWKSVVVMIALIYSGGNVAATYAHTHKDGEVKLEKNL